MDEYSGLVLVRRRGGRVWIGGGGEDRARGLRELEGSNETGIH